MKSHTISFESPLFTFLQINAVKYKWEIIYLQKIKDAVIFYCLNRYVYILLKMLKKVLIG